MRGPLRKSSTDSIVCPRCEIGRLKCWSSEAAGCAFCHRTVEIGILVALRRLAALPDPRGGHACECGHPEMRRLPDGVFWCPSCGSEVLPVSGHAPYDRGN